MPLVNKSHPGKVPLTIARAKSPLARALGLLGSNQIDSDRAVWITRCSSIHTFAMRYPIDIVCLDKDQRILELFHSVKPNRMIRPTKGTQSVLELEANKLRQLKLSQGDELILQPDCEHKPAAGAVRTFLHWPSNIGLGILWAQLVYLSVLRWQLAGEPLSLGILVYNTLLLVMFLSRRQSVETSTKLADWTVAMLTVAASLLFRPTGGAGTIFSAISSIMQTVAIIGVIYSLGSLGRSFGVIPANRQIKSSGAYSMVRHPLYTCELLFYVGFMIGHPSVRNAVLFTLILCGQIWRARSEEKILLKDAGYKTYYSKVSYRFIPGLY